MKYRIQLFLLVAFCVSVLGRRACAQVSYLNIKNYKVYHGVATRQSNDWVVLRRFKNDSKAYILLADPQTLETKVDEAANYQIRLLKPEEVWSYFKGSPYQKALKKADEQSISLQNAGITRGASNENGINLTVDLCPAHKPLDRRVFTEITERLNNPVPVLVSVSGIWMRQHPDDLEWLKQLQQENKLNITWANHSFNHKVNLLPLKENFLLQRGTDLNFEILETEQAMLKNGLVPSLFFRFPGLVSDQQLVYRIVSYGLMPLGADAWLAKGKQPHDGSIVLVHGNGNEPGGVNRLIRLLQSKSAQIESKEWLLYDLRESLVKEFGNTNK